MKIKPPNGIRIVTQVSPAPNNHVANVKYGDVYHALTVIDGSIIRITKHANKDWVDGYCEAMRGEMGWVPLIYAEAPDYDPNVQVDVAYARQVLAKEMQTDASK